MDNASKALVMAGAILIAVMLISLGVLLYNRATDVATSSLDSVNAVKNNADNQMYAQYLGAGKSKSQACSLLDLVMANNSNSENLILITTSGSYIPREASGATATTATAWANATATSTVADLRGYRNTADQTVNTLFTISVADYYQDGHIKTINIAAAPKA